jgi:outer membrane protein assembly factor BamB
VEAQVSAPPDASVYVLDDDVEVTRLLDEAAELEGREEWNDAVERYARLVETARDRLVAWGPRTYRSAAGHARARLADLPEPGRAALERRFGATAAEELASALERFDVAELRRIALGVPVAAAFRAGRALADYHMERGEWDAALRVLHRMLLVAPGGADAPHRLEARARAAYCRARMGDEPYLSALDPEGRDAGDATIRVQGEEVPIREFLATLRRLPPQSADAARAWTSFGGDDAHSRIPSLDATEFERVWSVSDLEPEGSDEDARPPLSQLEVDPNPLLPLFPVVDGDTVYVFNERTIRAVDLATGVERWRRSTDEFGPDAPDDRTYFYASVGSGAYVLVHEYVPATEGTGYDLGRYEDERSRRLVVLDVSDGSTRWVRGGKDDLDPSLRELRFTGPPIVVRDRVFVAAKQMERAGSEDKAFCVGFDLETGARAWPDATFLCSAPRPERGREILPEGPFLAYADGLLLCGTGMGILSAVDPDSGEHLWAFRYERAPDKVLGDSTPVYSYRETWADDPMIVRDGRIYSTPGDSPYLHLLLTLPDRDSGLVRLARLEKEQYRYLIGVVDRTVYLAGRDDARSYYWVSAFHPEGGERCNLWDFPLPNPLPGREGSVDRPRGRAILSRDRIYFPTGKGLYVLGVGNGDLVSYIPNPEGEDVRFGNLLATGDFLVSADRLRMHGFRAKQQ